MATGCSGSNLDPPPPIDPVATEFSQVSFAAWLTLSILLGVLLSMLAARRLVKPLAELAIAVEQLGGSGDASPIPAHGPRGGARDDPGLQPHAGEAATLQRRSHAHDCSYVSRSSNTADASAASRGTRRGSEQQQKMLAELDMMAEMIESVLSFARDDTKHEPRSLVDLSALVEGICEMRPMPVNQ